MSFPDPEMRKFLAKGTAEGVRAALSPHLAAGMTLAFDGDNFLIGQPGEDTHTAPINQQLKLTVAAANALFEGK